MNKLWYDKPAKLWRQALPVGNGFIGAMIYGGKSCEKIAFNDCYLWSGYPKDQTNENSLKYIDKVRELIFSGKNDEADKLTMEKLCGAYCESYMPVGDLIFKFSGVNTSEYKRELDISTAIHKVTTKGIERECFASYPQNILVYNIESKKQFNVKITAKSKMKSHISVDSSLNLLGNAPDYVAPNYLRTERKPIQYTDGLGMGYCLRCEPITNGETIYKKNAIVIKNATQVTIYATTSTGFKGYDKMPDNNPENAKKICAKKLKSINKNYKEIKDEHINDYNSIYSKQTLSLNDESKLSTFNLIKNAKNGNISNSLIELMYNYGKYLMISSSRKGTSAMNLQGIWNNSMRPPWSCNYTTNINAQMNYWSVTRSNLSDCIEPYVRLINEITQAGKKTAKINYGCSGSTCNHNVDIWRKTTPVQGDPAYMYAPLCGVWLANELYNHYKNGQLNEYKDTVLDILKENAQFANDYLIMHDGKYVTCPSASPEANFFNDNGKRANLDYASTFEMGLVKQIFINYLETFNDDLSQQINEKMPLLYPYNCGETGILEWHKDYKITENGHRHFSPLYAFYPANNIKYYENPTQVRWVSQLFNYRTDNSKQYIGWSAAWAICLAGRLHNGEKAIKVINSMLSHAVFYNLFCVHPPFLFQIDGNMGYIAGINEMLVYEENGLIELLGALPDTWKSGTVKNMVVNGTEISFEWKDNKLVNVQSNEKIKLLNSNISEKCNFNSNVEIINEIEVLIK